jgi:hypothetical protein
MLDVQNYSEMLLSAQGRVVARLGFA